MSGCDQWHRSGFFVVRVVGNVVLRAEHQCPALFDTAQPQGNECRQIAKLVLDGSQAGDDSRAQNTFGVRGHPTGRLAVVSEGVEDDAGCSVELGNDATRLGKIARMRLQDLELPEADGAKPYDALELRCEIGLELVEKSRQTLPRLG